MITIKTRLKIIKGKPDLVPLIDVLFLVISFIMLSSSFVQISGIKVDAPRSMANKTHSVGKFVVIIDKESHLFFNDRPVSWDELKQELTSLDNIQDSIIICADKNTPYDIIAKLLGITEACNLNAILVTNPIPSEKIIFKE